MVVVFADSSKEHLRYEEHEGKGEDEKHEENAPASSSVNAAPSCRASGIVTPRRTLPVKAKANVEQAGSHDKGERGPEPVFDCVADGERTSVCDQEGKDDDECFYGQGKRFWHTKRPAP